MKSGAVPRRMAAAAREPGAPRPSVLGAAGSPLPDKGLEADTVRLEDALAAAGIGAFQRRVWLLCGLAVSADGVEKAALMYILQGVSNAWGIHGEALGLLGSVSGLGQALGAYAFGRYSDAHGRRSALVLALAMTFVIGGLCAVAPGYVVFLILRFCVNVALGGALPCAFTLLAEFLPPRERPKWIPFLYAMYGVGRLVTAFVAWAVLERSWRLYMLLLALPCGVLLFLKGWIPESPHFLLVQEQPAQARKVIQEVASANGVTLPFGPCTQLRCEEEPVRNDSWITVLQTTAAKMLCVMWLLTALGSEWFNWALKLLKQSGVQSGTAYTGLLLFNTNELVVPLLLALLQRLSVMERARWTLTTTCVAAFLALLALAACSAAGGGPTLVVAASVAASYCGIAVWVVHYTVTPGYFATEVRGTGFGTCMAFNRLGYIVGPLIAAGMVEHNHMALLIFCSACYFFLVGCSLCLQSSPEGACEEGETTRLAESH